MKILRLLLLPVIFAGCSKIHDLPYPHEKGVGNEVSWRFVLYDSLNRIVDSTPEISDADSVMEPPVSGPNVVSVIPIIKDTIYWQPAASFAILTGPYDFGPQLGNLQVVKGGCAVNVIYNDPTLDRSGWNLQRTEKGHTIDMFVPAELSGYDGKYNDYPYPDYYDGIPYPSPFESNLENTSWICGTTQGSCRLSPVL